MRGRSFACTARFVRSLISSFFAATRSTSIWPCSGRCVRSCQSICTSARSKGMCCSASQVICSCSSAGVIWGMVIFLMITEWPLTRRATSRPLTLWKSLWSPSTTAPELMMWPSTIVWAGSGW